MAYIFGPVPSRRLGRSLGVDLVPFKTCSYDCIYCQLGQTTNKTVERRSWTPVDAALAELKDKLATNPDYITLSGSGEPTLHSQLGEIIAGIRSMTDVPVAVLTNGSLLWRKDVRQQLADAHLVIPSLDAGEASAFNAINRPHESISFEQMLEGLIQFRHEYRGMYWLEVFMLAGYTAVASEARKVIDCAERIGPDRIQLNTVTRPTAEDYAVMVPPEKLADMAPRFTPPAEIIADYHGVHAQSDFQAGRQSVLEMTSRRPCSLEDIADGLGLHRNEVIKYVEELSTLGLMDKQLTGGRLYYSGRRQPQKQSDMKEGPSSAADHHS